MNGTNFQLKLKQTQLLNQAMQQSFRILQRSGSKWSEKWKIGWQTIRYWNARSLTSRLTTCRNIRLTLPTAI